MIKTFTQTDLIRYLYRETTEEETTEIDKALLCDAELMTMFSELKDTVRSVDKANLEPSASSIANILLYSRSHQKTR